MSTPPSYDQQHKTDVTIETEICANITSWYHLREYQDITFGRTILVSALLNPTTDAKLLIFKRMSTYREVFDFLQQYPELKKLIVRPVRCMSNGIPVYKITMYMTQN